MTAGFEAGLTNISIEREVTNVNETPVSSRTVSRYRSEWRKQRALDRLIHEATLAVHAIEGEPSVIDHLARCIQLDAGWRDRRERAISDKVEQFKRGPSPKAMAEVQHQMALLLFESHFEAYIPRVTGQLDNERPNAYDR